MKHTGRSLLSLTLALLLAAGLCGCAWFGGSDGPQGDDPVPTEPVIPDQVPVRITATRLSDGAVLSDRRMAYDQYGNVTTEIDYQFGLLEQGYYTYTYEYGPKGFPTQRDTYLVTQTRTRLTAIETFDSVGRVIERMEYNNAEKRVLEYAYDSRGNETLYVSYDDGGRMVSKLETTYDEAGQRLTEQYTSGSGSTVHREYQDGLCSHRVETDTMGNETEYTYTIKWDNSGNLLTYGAANAKTGRLNFWKEYQNTYNEDGLLTAVEVTDQNGECVARSSYQYDQECRVVKSDEQEFTGANESREVWDITYNDSGAVVRREQLQSRLNSGGSWEESLASYQYDQDGLLTGFTYRQDGHSLNFTIGRVNGQPVVLKKDCDGPLPFTDFDLTFTGENDFTMDSASYSGADAAFLSEDSYARVYTYKEDGRLSTVEETVGDGTTCKRWDYTYARPGNTPEQTVTTLPLNGGANTIELYDGENKLLSQVSLTYNQQGFYDTMTNGDGAYHYTYETDEQGRTVGTQYDAGGNSWGVMTYDTCGNLVEDLIYGDPRTILLRYEYDAMGNQSTSYPWSSGKRAYCAYAYDDEGRHTAMTLYVSAQRGADELLEQCTYSYDASGRLRKMTRYDADGVMLCYMVYQYES